MSYELIFWKEQSGKPMEARSIYKALAGEQPVDGLDELPIDEWLAAVMSAFPEARVQPNAAELWLEWTSPDKSESFQLTWSTVHVRVDCRRVSGERMNRLVEIGAAFGCPLYDPQIDERFDAWTDR